MSGAPTMRAHLVERAVEAARASAAGNLAPGAAPGPARPQPRRQHEPPAPVVALPEVPAPLSLEALLGAGMIGPAGGRSRIGEEVALVRDQVLRTIAAVEPQAGRDARIVLVTSARRGEGKSFTALNLAASIAQGTQTPALIVDTEGLPGGLTDRLGLAEARGLQTLIDHPSLDPRSLAVPTAIAGLSMLPWGGVGRTGGVAAQASAVNAAVLGLAQSLPEHVIVVDTAACLSASSAGLLAATAGQVLMVVLAETTQRAEVEAALDIVDACPNLELVLNRVRLTVSESFGDHGATSAHASQQHDG